MKRTTNRRSRLKYAYGDPVRSLKLPGRWTVWSGAPGDGRYWLRPRDDDARALADLQRYGMVTEHVSQLRDDRTPQ